MNLYGPVILFKDRTGISSSVRIEDSFQIHIRSDYYNKIHAIYGSSYLSSLIHDGGNQANIAFDARL